MYNNKKRIALNIFMVILVAAMVTIFAAILAMLPARADTDNETADDVVGVNFASGELYEGGSIDPRLLTVTITFADGHTRVLDTDEYYIPTTLVGHDDMTVPVETEYGTFNWLVPVNPVVRMYIEADANPVGSDVPAYSFTYMTEFASGRHFIARPNLLQTPDITVKIGTHDTFTVTYDGIEYEVVAP